MSNWKKHIFLHIPKTAGTTLTGVINKNYKSSEISQLYNPSSFDDDLHAALSNNSIKMLYGHFAYESALNAPDLYVFTFLREPISRTISNYIHLKNSQDPQHKTWMKDVKSISDFLHLKQAFNWQARHLSGQKFSADFGADLNASLEMAKENLERMNFVGLTERFEDSLMCLSADLGWTKLRHTNQNVQKNATEAEEIKVKYAEQIAEQNKLDIELYNLSLRLLENNLAKITAPKRLLFAAKKLL